MLELIDSTGARSEGDPGHADTAASEPGIYSEPGIPGTTLYTFIGYNGEPIGSLLLTIAPVGGEVPYELQALYDHCAEAMASRTRPTLV